MYVWTGLCQNVCRKIMEQLSHFHHVDTCITKMISVAKIQRISVRNMASINLRKWTSIRRAEDSLYAQGKQHYIRNRAAMVGPQSQILQRRPKSLRMLCSDWVFWAQLNMQLDAGLEGIQVLGNWMKSRRKRAKWSSFKTCVVWKKNTEGVEKTPVRK